MSDPKLPECGDVKITPEMIEAGAEILYRHFGDVLPYESSLGLVAAAEVFEAMTQADCEADHEAATLA